MSPKGPRPCVFVRSKGPTPLCLCPLQRAHALVSLSAPKGPRPCVFVRSKGPKPLCLCPLQRAHALVSLSAPRGPRPCVFVRSKGPTPVPLPDRSRVLGQSSASGPERAPCSAHPAAAELPEVGVPSTQAGRFRPPCLFAGSPLRLPVHFVLPVAPAASVGPAHSALKPLLPV
jgi:hypothetical protein